MCSCFACIEVTQDIINWCNSPGGSPYPLPKRPHKNNISTFNRPSCVESTTEESPFRPASYLHS